MSPTRQTRSMTESSWARAPRPLDPRALESRLPAPRLPDRRRPDAPAALGPTGPTGPAGPGTLQQPAPAPSLDAVALLDGLAELVDLGNSGVGGPPGLQLAAELAQAATGAIGAAFIEYTGSGGRVVVTTRELEWALGRPVDISEPAVAQLQNGPRVEELTVEKLTDDTGYQLRAFGVRRVIRAVAVDQGVLVGALQACFPDAGGRATPYQLSAVRLLASCAAHLYREGPGLPVYPDGPVVAPLGQGMAVVGADTTVRSWSPAAARITGRPFEAAIGRPLVFPVPDEGRPLLHEIEPGRWIRARATVLPGATATVVTFRETAEPEPAEQARDLFIAVTSHELRTPVTVIRGYADTLVEHWDSLDESARREAVFVVGQRARELARLVDRLLNAASDTAGLLDPSSGVPFDLVDALRDAVAELGPDLRRCLRVAVPAGLPLAHGDRASLATVLTELVTNAHKYSPDGVDMELTAGADAQTVWFRLADRGLGIRPEHVERAFERFWQLDRGDQRRYGGVGLGLYLVRRIVERQRGWVSLRPRDGGGTVAEVRLPRAESSAGEA